VGGLVHVSQVSYNFTAPEKLSEEFEIEQEVNVIIMASIQTKEGYL